MELTPGQVKNLMRRGLRRLVDPEPDRLAKLEVWRYFQSRCAYCDTPLVDRNGDIDHLIPAALGGSNALANRVLACKPCNAQEKRDEHWESFLQRKCADPAIRELRARRIRAWVLQNGGHPTLDRKILELLDAENERVTAEYDLSCQRLREARR